MSTKIAILRGINVGGRRKILMGDLKEMLKEIGLGECQTYIQSGNVFFQSKKENKQLENEIEKAIIIKFDFKVPVIVKDSKEIQDLVLNNPFYNQKEEIAKLHLTFLKEKPTQEIINAINSMDCETDRFVIDEKSVFICCEGKYHESKLTNNFFEKKLGVGATTRNWKTVLKFAIMCKEFNN